jgi:hypothetical protein
VNFILILKELWHRRLLVALAAVAAALAAVLAVYDVSFPPSVSKRDQQEARGSVEILVDSSKSPIADVGRELEPLTSRAGVFARYLAGGDVVKLIAERTGVPLKKIEVAGPAPQPGEAPGIATPPPVTLPYELEIAQQDAALPILNIATRAPTVEAARSLAAAAPGALRRIVIGIQRRQGIPDDKRVTFRELGPAEANVDKSALGAKAALFAFIVVFGLLVLLILVWPRFASAWRGADLEPQRPPRPSPKPPDQIGADLPPSPTPGTRALASASIAAAEEIVKRDQLELPEQSGKDSGKGSSSNGSSNGSAEPKASPFGASRES